MSRLNRVEHSDEPDLPPDVALLWGLRDTVRRGPKPSLTVPEITRTAIRIADAEGLAAVSMARLAAELGNSTMALYRYVRSKDELLTLMSDAALEQPPELPADADWRTGLTLWATAVLSALRQHRWYAGLPITRPPAGPNNLAWLDNALGALDGTGLAPGVKMGIVLGLITYVHGEVRLSSDLDAGYAANPQDFARSYSRTLSRVVDERRLPALAAVVAAGVFDVEEAFDDSDFGFGLGLYLDGVARFIEGSAAAGVT